MNIDIKAVRMNRFINSIAMRLNPSNDTMEAIRLFRSELPGFLEDERRIALKFNDCDYCEGLGFRTVSVENDQGLGEIEQEQCSKCYGLGIIQ